MDILLYSKFSNASKQLMKQLQQTPELLESITITCIDNKMIRKQIVSDEKVKINYLPCFIRLNEQTGNFDIYEGKNAFDFFSTLQEQIMQQYQPEPYHQAQPPPQPPPQPTPQPIPQPPPQPTHQPPPQQKRRPIPPVQTSVQTPVQPPVKTIKQKAQEAENQRNQYDLKDTKIKEEFITKQTKNLKKNLSTPVKNVTFTPISELGLDNLQDVNELSKNNENKGGKDEDDDEVEDEGDYGGEGDDGDDTSLKENQPTSISTYTHISKNSNSEFSEREVQSKQAEINASKNTGSILAKAMKMQKERN